MIPQANQIYKHFKGNLYKVITTAVHTETEEQLVIYQALYGDFKVYARPLAMFTEEVDKVKYPDVSQKMRFEPVQQLVEPVVATAEQASKEMPSLDPMVEAYLDTDSYREKINILHGLQHRITEDMLTTMAIAIDFELPEGDINTQYDALNNCLLTKEKYECSRII